MSTKSTYILINAEFALANKSYCNSKGCFGFGITTDNRYVCAANTVTDFPELFQGFLPFPGILIVELDINDFPKPTFP